MPIEALPTYVTAILFVIALAALVKGADWFVSGASSLARRLGTSQLVIGLTVVSLGTSAPELAVSIFASLNGSGSIALGNVVGSNIFNLGFILAMCAIAVPLKVEKKVLYRDTFFLIGSSVVLLAMIAWDLELARWEGLLLLSGLVIYLSWLALKSPKELISPDDGDDQEEIMNRQKTFFFLAIGLASLLLGSRLVVDIASHVATELGVTEWLIGVTIVAVGTSLPEVLTAATSIIKKKVDLGIGSLIGSDIFNIVGVLGITAIVKPFTTEQIAVNQLIFLIGAIVLMAVFLRTGWVLSRREGFALFGIALARYLTEIF